MKIIDRPIKICSPEILISDHRDIPNLCVVSFRWETPVKSKGILSIYVVTMAKYEIKKFKLRTESMYNNYDESKNMKKVVYKASIVVPRRHRFLAYLSNESNMDIMDGDNEYRENVASDYLLIRT